MVFLKESVAVLEYYPAGLLGDPVFWLAGPRLAGIDLNSGFEIEPGLKDVDKLKNFIQQILHPAVETGRAPSPTV